ncbi:alpha/beta fold hydrolase [Acrocarpospora macrocephala]|uniref:Alpha/beta hydrolase n=1 Tax=Acrocarpospora macrocephala TaxID=150177 RepID=A0A5M3X2N3_9ACTN|nr:lysophospholipase [Acrocarpospora macrocephala]GES13861.1 alpha/beta hydrolase [Acrocarpospora macrocephala]
MSPTRTDLLAVPMADVPSANEIYSGVARISGTLWCTRHRAHPDRRAETAVVAVHPSSNFMGHYALTAIAGAGYDAIGMTTRYLGNDSALLLENCVVDVGSVIRYLRTEGYEQVVLFGNSGGGALAALYQNQAERPSITSSPGGGGPDLTRADLPPADLLILAMAHPGRSQLLTETLDPSIADEAAPFARDPGLDMYDASNGIPYDASWLRAYRIAQRARNDAITAWAEGMLGQLAERGIADLPFVVHGVGADPRYVDLSLDPNDREPGTLWGDPWNANFQPATLGHFTTVRAWLSQWSRSRSRGHAPDLLPSVTTPVHVVYGTADQSCFPSHARELYDSIPHDDRALTAIGGGRHYLHGQPEQLATMIDAVSTWIDAHRG